MQGAGLTRAINLDLITGALPVGVVGMKGIKLGIGQNGNKAQEKWGFVRGYIINDRSSELSGTKFARRV